MIWNKKKDGAENPGAETPAAQTASPGAVFAEELEMARAGGLCGDRGRCVFAQAKSASTTAVDPSYLETSLKCGMSPTP